MEGDTHSLFDDQSKDFNYLPHWLMDDDLKNSETETLPASEEQFWLDLIDKYLQPKEPTEEEKVLIQQIVCSFLIHFPF